MAARVLGRGGWTPVFALLCGVLAGSTDAGCDPVVFSAFELQTLDRTNAARAGEGVAPVTMHPELTRVARRFARYLKENASGYPHYLGHESLDGTTSDERIRARRYRATISGENLGARDEPLSAASVNAMIDQWEQSGEHWDVIVHPAFEDVGFGYYDGPGDPTALAMYGAAVFGTHTEDGYWVGDVELLTPTDEAVFAAGEEYTAQWSLSEWVTSVWVRVSTDGGMEWTTLVSSAAVHEVTVQLPAANASGYMFWVGSTDPIDRYWSYDSAVCMEVVDRPRWLGIVQTEPARVPRLLWTSVSGQRYEVEARAGSGGEWDPLAEVVADDSETSWDDASWKDDTGAGPQRQYRVRALGP